MDGNVLLAHQIGADNTFLPGGHVELGEKAEPALAREIAEEIGQPITVKQFVGAVEWSYAEDDQRHHGIDLVFEVVAPGLAANAPPPSHEPRLEFIWAKPADLRAHNLQPSPMIECLRNWERSYRGFWGSTFEEAPS